MSAVSKAPELGRKSIALKVKLPQPKVQDADHLGVGLRELYKMGELTDIELVCAERSFPCHRVVLASQSDLFKEGLGSGAAVAAPAPGEKRQLRLAEISNPEAVKFMLDYMYALDVEETWTDYNPETQEINKDVLRLAENFKLAGLKELAVHWLSKDITTANCVERLGICEDFELPTLRDKILEQLTFNKKALSEVASSQQIMQHPELMRSMLKLAATEPMETQEAAQPKKKPRKG